MWLLCRLGSWLCMLPWIRHFKKHWWKRCLTPQFERYNWAPDHLFILLLLGYETLQKPDQDTPRCPGGGAASWCSKRDCIIIVPLLRLLPLQSSFSLVPSSSRVLRQSGQYLICQATSLQSIFMSQPHETSSIFSNISTLQLSDI